MTEFLSAFCPSGGGAKRGCMDHWGGGGGGGGGGKLAYDERMRLVIRCYT